MFTRAPNSVTGNFIVFVAPTGCILTIYYVFFQPMLPILWFPINLKVGKNLSANTLSSGYWRLNQFVKLKALKRSKYFTVSKFQPHFWKVKTGAHLNILLEYFSGCTLLWFTVKRVLISDWKGKKACFGLWSKNCQKNATNVDYLGRYDFLKDLKCAYFWFGFIIDIMITPKH